MRATLRLPKLDGTGMNRRLSFALTLASLSVGLATPTAAAGDDGTHSRWKGVIACVDRNFFDGGHEAGDPVREALMNDFLALQELPAYAEDGQQQDARDSDAYMAGYESCDARWSELEGLAKKHGIGAVED